MKEDKERGDICLRCRKPFDSPIPEVTYPEGLEEIACIGWCPDCNALVMSIIYRESSSYGLFRRKK